MPPTRGRSAVESGHQRNGISEYRYHGVACGLWMRCMSTVNRMAAAAEPAANARLPAFLPIHTDSGHHSVKNAG